MAKAHDLILTLQHLFDVTARGLGASGWGITSKCYGTITYDINISID
jgi:hypothetical protein